jgi:hypothetical protein
MQIRLSLIINNIQTISIENNRTLVQEFYDHINLFGTSDKCQNNFLL